MTEFSEIVENQRILMEAEEWGAGIKYIHANNGIIETAFNNGDIQYDRDGRISWHREKPTKQTLFDKFERAMTDLISRRK